MSAKELIRRLQRHDPELPVLMDRPDGTSAEPYVVTERVIAVTAKGETKFEKVVVIQ